MQAYTREKLVMALDVSRRLADQYQAKDPLFIANSIQWFEQIEAELAKLRHPLVSLLAAKRIELSALAEGNVTAAHHSKRKAMRFESVVVLEAVEQHLRSEVERIDGQFADWRDKIAQLAAIASRQAPIQLTDSELSNTALGQIWQQFGKAEEGANMHQYLSAILPKADLLYLLKDVILNLLDNRTYQ